MSWSPEVEELNRRKAMAMEMGGRERVARQHEAGRLTVRERIARLADRGTFREIGAIAGTARYDETGTLAAFSPANCVFGFGEIAGRSIVIAGDDFTLRGGSADASIWEKFKTAERLAFQYRIPLIRLVEGSGGGGSVRSLEKSGYANLPGGVGGQSGGLHLCCANLAAVPVVGLALGSVAGLGAGRVCISHYSIMVRDMSAMFVAGPPVVERLGEKRTKQDLGGWRIQLAAGTVDHVAASEDEAFAVARRFLSYLPSSVWELPPRVESDDSPTRRDEALLSIVPRDARGAYRMHRIIESVCDQGSFFEMCEH
ncbi:MAG: methylmalonyl-CoA carboxyltransferase, partial [Methylobacteriaceae bacterium]|nr:methylmalonyl-CoA carboxyltransferase [Methylobacteriaceae bacterium]